jgi:outer membrane receptor protein involved in Fe transport
MKRTGFKRGLVLFLLTLIWLGQADQLAAQTEAAPTQVTLDTVVVTATRTEKKIQDVTSAVSVVTREEIDRMPATTVMDVLRNTVGVTVEDDRSGYGSSTSNKVVIRGMGGNGQSRVLVLVDGMPALTPGSSIFEWSSVNLNTVERIEVVRGPSSALYGSSAMGGVINIITKRPAEDGFETRIKSRYGRYNSWDENLYHSGRINKFSYSISAGYTETHGFNAVPLESVSGNQRPDGKNSAPERVENYTGVIKLRYDFEDDADLTFTADYADYERTGRWQHFNFNPDTYRLYTYQREGVGLQLHQKFGFIDSRLSLRADFVETDYDFNLSTRTEIESTNPNTTKEYSFDQSNTMALGDSNTVTFGFAGLKAIADRDMHYISGTDNGRYRGRSGEQYNLAFFFQDEISLLDNKLMVVPGFRYDYWHTEGYDVDTNRVDPSSRNDYAGTSAKRLSPKLGIRIKPADDLIIFKANYGEGFHMPTLDDLYSGYMGANGVVYQGNGDLKPETSRSFDVGIEVNPCNQLSFNLTAFSTRAKNYIGNVQLNPGVTPAIHEKQNVDNVKIRGFEAGFQYRPTDHLTFFADGSLTDARVVSGANSGNHVSYTPESKASLGFSFDHPDWFKLRASATRTGRIWQDLTENESLVEGGFWMGDLRVSKRFDFDKFWAEPFVEMTNITNRSEARFINSSRMPINTVYGGLEFGF